MCKAKLIIKSSVTINTTFDKMSSEFIKHLLCQYILPFWYVGNSLINYQDLLVCKNIFFLLKASEANNTWKSHSPSVTFNQQIEPISSCFYACTKEVERQKLNSCQPRSSNSSQTFRTLKTTLLKPKILSLHGPADTPGF